MKGAKLPAWTELPELTADGRSGQGADKRKVPEMSRLIVMAVLPALALAVIALMRPGSGSEADARSEGIAVRANRALSPITPTETEGAIGGELALAVRVSGPRGTPVERTVVSWRLVGGGGAVLAADSVLTNENGEALNSLRLPPEPGRVMVVVRAPSAEPPQVGFFVDVVVPRPRRVRLALGSGQTAPVGTPLPEPLAVEVTDPDGVAVPDVAVRFKVSTGDGELEQEVVFTDSLGHATTRWTLGPDEGTQKVSAQVQAAGDTVVDFLAKAVENAGAPAATTAALAGTPTSGADAPTAKANPATTGADAPTAKANAATARADAPIPSTGTATAAEDTAAADTETTPAPETTAVRTDRSKTAEPTTVPEPVATPPAEPAPPPLRRISGSLGTGQRAPAGETLPEPLEVHVTDAKGRDVPDVAVLFRVHSGGGRLERRLVFTDTRGRAITRWTLGPEAGKQDVTARVQAAGDTVFGFTANAIEVAALPEPAATPSRGDGAPVPPRRLGAARGDGQSAPTGAVLPRPLEVHVTDADGAGVPDVAVHFQVSSGGGTLGRRVVFTDTMGRATTQWTLGPRAGRQKVTARVQAVGDTVFGFVATALEVAAPAKPAPSPTVAKASGPEESKKNGSAEKESEARPAEAAAASRPEPKATSTASSTAEASRPEPRPETTTPSSRPATASLPIARSVHTVGGEHVCVLVGGVASCRGANDRGQLSGTSASGLLALAAGLTHTCGVDESGVAFCWGGNDRGQLGDGSTTDRSVATRVQGGLRFASVAAGASHTCGLSRSGEVLCWGANINGQLGDGSRDDRHQPRPVATDVAFRGLVAGWNHTCGLDAKGAAYCWGLNGEGQLGDGTRLDRLAPVRVPGDFSVLVAGAAHTCGLSGRRVLCWGDNSFGQLGDGTNEDHARPVAVAGSLEGVIALAAGAMHTCALLDDGSVHCWGQNRRGELGDGTTENKDVPTRAATDVAFRSLEAGGAITCAFSNDWTEYCWGQNRSGQLGEGTRGSRPVPTRSTVRY